MNKLISAFLGPALISLIALCLPAAAEAPQLKLLMIEQPGCTYCARWDAEIAPAYPKTEEGQAAPLQRHQLNDPVPEGMQLTSPPVFTPTFILLADGTETGRIQGYPGADFFWPLLAGLIAKAPKE